VLDQGDKPHCVAFTAASMKMNHEHRQHRRYYAFEADELYARCEERDGFPGIPGTTNRAMMSIVSERGMYGRRGAANPRHPFKIGGYVRLTTLQRIKEALLETGPVVIGLDIDTQWEDGAVDPKTGEIGAPNGDLLGGHDVLVVGFHDRWRGISGRSLPKGVLRIKNSWARAGALMAWRGCRTRIWTSTGED
jgi:hypothetical protein